MICKKCNKEIQEGKFFHVPEEINQGERRKLKIAFYVVCEECSKGAPFKIFQDVYEGEIVEEVKNDNGTLSV